MFPSEPSQTGVVIVDHGSRKEESNRRLEQFVELFRSRTDYRVVEPAHMELASPSIEEAFGSCVGTGVSSILLVPLLFSPAWENLALPRSCWFLSCSLLLGGLGGLRPPRSFPVFPSFFPASSLLFRVSSLLCLPSVLLSSSDLVPPCSPHGASVVLSRLAGSLPVRPCFFPTLYCHFFVLLCFVVIALLPCSFQVLLTPCLVKSC